MNDVKKAYAWQEAIELSKQLVMLCEEFRDAATNVLVWHLRQAVVEVPAGVAADLQANRAASMESAAKLTTALELVRRIYPGIETSSAEAQLERLMQRMDSQDFSECEPEPETEAASESDTAEPKAATVQAQDQE